MATTENQHTSFTTRRLRRGYEMTEVDHYLADTAGAMRARDEEIAELRRQLAERPTPEPVAQVPSAGEASTAAAWLLEVAAANADQLLRETTAQAAEAVATAEAEADQVIAAARAEAEQLIAIAREAAKQVTRTAQQKAERVTAAARDEAVRIRREPEDRRVPETAALAELQ